MTRGRKAEKRKRVETDEEADEEELAKEKRIVTRMQAEMEREYTGWRKYVEQELKVTSNRLVVVCEAVRTIRDDVKQIAAIAADTLLAVERLERRLDEEQEEALERMRKQRIRKNRKRNRWRWMRRMMRMRSTRKKVRRKRRKRMREGMGRRL